MNSWLRSHFHVLLCSGVILQSQVRLVFLGEGKVSFHSSSSLITKLANIAIQKGDLIHKMCMFHIKRWCTKFAKTWPELGIEWSTPRRVGPIATFILQTRHISLGEVTWFSSKPEHNRSGTWIKICLLPEFMYLTTGDMPFPVTYLKLPGYLLLGISIQSFCLHTFLILSLPSYDISYLCCPVG